MTSNFSFRLPKVVTLLLTLVLAVDIVISLTFSNRICRRQAFGTLLGPVVTLTTWIESSNADDSSSVYNFEGRDRQNNKDAVIREDYWYLVGKTPPRLLTTQLKGDDPKWNAFGSCSQADGGNSCTYVSLNQRIPAYSKYASSILYGSTEYAKLGQLLQQLSTQPTSNNEVWEKAARYVERPGERQLPPGPVDAELKLVLFATAMTTSPNFPQPGKELLVARFYANEVRYANRVIRDAIHDRDAPKCLEAWKFGQDSWNSYFQVVNRSISPKVGEKFEFISI